MGSAAVGVAVGWPISTTGVGVGLAATLGLGAGCGEHAAAIKDRAATPPRRHPRITVRA
jgi:hypothetical protein